MTFARVFGSPSRWLAEVRLANVHFSLLACLITSVSDSISYRRLRPMARIARLGWMTARGARGAWAANGRRPGATQRWAVSAGSDRSVDPGA